MMLSPPPPVQKEVVFSQGVRSCPTESAEFEHRSCSGQCASVDVRLHAPAGMCVRLRVRARVCVCARAHACVCFCFFATGRRGQQYC
mmetsp:Transcript_50414/g.109273  ORF Transcript_50414/g.109273 Transcript_50414/m.109273 type:complete len:87 (+) Transcript_50414:554-814(+)|eukprot:1458900-Pleurochrysis_carterae.AAC.2